MTTTPPAQVHRPDGFVIPALVAAAVALIGRLPVLGAWWSGADWSRLAVAAGLESGGGGWPVERLYWAATWPVLGLNADGQALVRLGLHALSAFLLVRIASRAGLGRRRRTLAGLVFGVAPLGFAPLYVASGTGLVLGTTLGLAALDRWIAAVGGNRTALWTGTLLAVLAVASGPHLVALPVLLGACTFVLFTSPADPRLEAWGSVIVQAVIAVGVVLLVSMGHDGPLLAAPREVLSHLGACGWWLVSPVPSPVATVNAPMAGAGAVLLLGWAIWAVVGWRNEARWPALTFAAAAVALAPVVLRAAPPVAGDCYLALAPLGLLVGALVPTARLGGRDVMQTAPLLGALGVAAAAFGFFSAESRLNARDADGLVADGLARSTALSWQSCRTIRNLQDQSSPASGGKQLDRLVLFQPLVGPEAAAMAASIGERWTLPSPLSDALGGTLGPRLVLGPGSEVAWMNGLTTASSEALVLCETPTGFRLWGRTPNALLYAALTDVAEGRFARARAHLKRAAELGDEQIVFIYDEGQMVVPLARVLEQRSAFFDWTVSLLDAGVSRLEVGGLQDMFVQLLSRATGRSVADLTAGSHLVGPPRRETAGPDPE